MNAGLRYRLGHDKYALRQKILVCQPHNFFERSPARCRQEKYRVGGVGQILKAIPPIDEKDVVRGQFRGYRDEDGVAKDSQTETFAVVKLEINSWRWKGVPFLHSRRQVFAHDVYRNCR